MQGVVLWAWRSVRGRAGGKDRAPKSRPRRIADALVTGLLLGYLFLLCFPQVLFAHSVSYRNFRVYSASPINGAIYPVLRSAEQKLAVSEVNDPRASQRIFLCPSHAAFAFFAPFARTGFAVNLPFRHNIFVNTADVAADEVVKGAMSYDRRSLSGVLAHECTHTLLAERFGQARTLLLPSWKQEGYCDYVAQATSFDRAAGLRLLQEGRSDPAPSFFYFKAFTAVAHLEDDRHWSVARIMDTPLRLDQVVQEAVPPE